MTASFRYITPSQKTSLTCKKLSKTVKKPSKSIKTPKKKSTKCSKAPKLKYSRTNSFIAFYYRLSWKKVKKNIKKSARNQNGS
jgi:hypothetical protein